METKTIELKRIIPPVYYKFHESLKNKQHRWYKLDGGRYSGKSSVVSLEIPIEIIRNQTKGDLSNILVVRRYSNTLNDSVVNQIEWGLQKLGFAPAWKKYTNRARFVHRETGQMIRFVGLDDNGKLKGLKPLVGRWTHVWFEEYDQLDCFDDILQVVNSIARPSGLHEEISDADIESYLADPEKYESDMITYAFSEDSEDEENSENEEGYNDLPVTVFLTCNPPNEIQHWIYDPKLFKGNEFFCQLTNYMQLPKNLVSRDFIRNAENVKRNNFSKWLWLYKGIPQSGGGAIFKNFVDGWHMTDEQYHTLCSDNNYQGLDWGYSVDPACWCRLWYGNLDGKRTLIVLDEIYSQFLSNDELSKKIYQKAPDLIGTPLPADSSEPKSIAKLASLGHMIYGVNKRTPTRNEKLKWLSLDVDQILIDSDRTPNAYKEVKYYMFPKNKQGQYISVYPDKDNHFLDACVYAMRDVIMTEINTFW